MLSSERYKPSSGTLFDYSDSAGMFSWHCPELEELEAKVNTEEVVNECEDDLTNLERFLEALKDRPNLVVFSITTFGIACGPVSDTVHICIDMNYQGG